MNYIPIIRNYQGNDVTFRNENGTLYINATEMAKPFGKRPNDYVSLPSTREFMETITEVYGNCDNQLVITRVGSPQYGGGTWMREDLALDFAQWLSPKFRLWCNDQIRSFLVSQNIPAQKSEAEELEIMTRTRFAAIKEVKELLRLDDSSVALLSNPVLVAIGLPAIPYVKSNGARSSAKALLKRNGATISAEVFNKIMERNGYLEHKSRHSTSSKDNIKWYWCVTEKGKEYGENVVCPNNVRETRPLWFDDKFPALLDAIGVSRD